MASFVDGTGITPGSERCQCTSECEFPCWQRIGWAPACSPCGCPPFQEHEDSKTLDTLENAASYQEMLMEIEPDEK